MKGEPRVKIGNIMELKQIQDHSIYLDHVFKSNSLNISPCSIFTWQCFKLINFFMAIPFTPRPSHASTWLTPGSNSDQMLSAPFLGPCDMWPTFSDIVNNTGEKYEFPWVSSNFHRLNSDHHMCSIWYSQYGCGCNVSPFHSWHSTPGNPPWHSSFPCHPCLYLASTPNRRTSISTMAGC